MSAGAPQGGGKTRMARSLLFVPATSTRKIDKAFASAADAVILDLEDAVAIPEKPAARAALAGIVGVPRALPAWVRINALATAWCHQDIVAATIPGIAGLILPKVESAGDIRTVDWLMTQLEGERGLPSGSVALMAIVETARGLQAVGEIAAASPRLVRLMFGAVDLAADMTIDIDDAAGATGPSRFAIAVASAAAGIASPLDTAFVDIGDPQALRATSLRAKALGYSGKTCIHPSQIAVVDAVFAPTAAEIEWARRVVTTFAEAEADGRGAVQVDGRMIDYPVVYRAERILANR